MAITHAAIQRGLVYSYDFRKTGSRSRPPPRKNGLIYPDYYTTFPSGSQGLEKKFQKPLKNPKDRQKRQSANGNANEKPRGKPTAPTAAIPSPLLGIGKMLPQNPIRFKHHIAALPPLSRRRGLEDEIRFVEIPTSPRSQNDQLLLRSLHHGPSTSFLRHAVDLFKEVYDCWKSA